MLQGPSTSHTVNDQIKRHLKYRRTDLHIVTNNYKKDGTSFTNKLYLAPVVNEDEDKVVRWIGVLFDASAVNVFAERKPIVQGIINVCKYLINNVRNMLKVTPLPLLLSHCLSLLPDYLSSF